MSKRARRHLARRLRICHSDFICHWSFGFQPGLALGLLADFVRPDPTDERGRLVCRRFNNATVAHSSAHSPIAIKTSLAFGENIRKKSLPLTRAEKLETQNGIMNRRMICQRSSFTRVPPVAAVLMNRANPMIRLKPSEVSHRRG